MKAVLYTVCLYTYIFLDVYYYGRAYWEPVTISLLTWPCYVLSMHQYSNMAPAASCHRWSPTLLSGGGGEEIYAKCNKEMDALLPGYTVKVVYIEANGGGGICTLYNFIFGRLWVL